MDDGAGLLFAGPELIETVSARRGARAYWVEEAAGDAIESPLDAVALPGRDEVTAPTPLSIVEWRESRARRRLA